jgi:hypothetical protein
MADDIGKLRDDLEEFNDGLSDSSRVTKDLIQVFRSLNKEVKDLKGDADISEYIKENTRLLKEADKQYGNISNSITKVLQGESDIKDIKKQQESLNSNISKLTNVIQTNHSKILSLQKDNSAESKKAAAALELQNSELRDQFTVLKETSKEYDKAATFAGKLNDAIGPAGQVLKIMGANIKGFSEFTGEAAEKMQKYAAEQVELNGKASQFKTTMVGINAVGQSFLTKLFSFQAIFGFIVHSALHADATMTKISKTMGISKDEAHKVETSFKNIALNSEYSSVSISSLVEGMGQLSEATGVSAGFSNDMLEQQAVLTKQMGLSADEAAKINTMSMMNNKSTQETKVGIANQVKGLEKQTGIKLNYKKVMQDVAKVDGQLAAQYKNNPELIAKAVIQVQKLGINLQQAAAMGKNLLNWESSIEAELEAELLTGKQLNLEDARNLALKGKSAEAAAEMLKQVGSAAEFSEMDAIQQEAIAKSMGMQVDDLANSLREKELLNKLGAENIKQLDEQGRLDELKNEEGGAALVAAYEQQSAQEKMNQAMVKLSEILGALVAGPLGTMMDYMASLASNAGALYTVLGAISILMGGKMLMSLGRMVAQLGVAVGLSTAKAVAEMTAASALTLGLGTIGIVAAAAAGAAGIYSLVSKAKSMNDGVMAPDGKVLYSGKEGAIKLNDNDTVVAGTDLGGGKSGKSKSESKSGAGGGTTDLSPLLAKVDQLITLLQNGSQVTLDGKAVGRAMGLNSVNANMA